MKRELLLCLAVAALFVLLCLAWFFGWYAYYRKKLTDAALDGIADLEETELPNAEKMETLVRSLAALLPAAVRRLIPLDALWKLAQSVFDAMKRYAKAKAQKK